MAHSAPKELTPQDTAVLGNRSWSAYATLLIIGAVCVAIALVLTLFSKTGTQHFGFAYVTAYAFVFAITIGSLFFVLITHLFRAGWCVMVRRIAESYSRNIPLMVVLFVPIAFYVYAWSGDLYPWARDFSDKEHATAVETLAASGYSGLDPELAAAYDADQAAHGVEVHSNDDTHASGILGAEEGESNEEIAMEAVAAPVFAGGNPYNPDMAEGHGAGHADAAGHGDSKSGAYGESYTYTGDTWADHDHAIAYFVKAKAPWFSPVFWSIRWVVYFVAFGGIAWFFHRLSVKQDETRDPELTNKREWWAPLSVACFAFSIMAVSVDLVMSLDPVWYSTMFGIVIFANAFTAAICMIILTVTVLKKFGYLPNVTVEHQHDLSKLLFAFVFFWGYVAFSQFMLIWYASLPETTYWFEMRGITGRAIGNATPIDGSAATAWSGWTWMSIFILFGHLFIPFAALLSRHVKRNTTARTIIAAWMLMMVYVDFYWYVMPVYLSPTFQISPIAIFLALGLLAFTVAGALRIAARHSLVAKGDPRLHESLALDAEVWAPLYPKPKPVDHSTQHPTMA